MIRLSHRPPATFVRPAVYLGPAVLVVFLAACQPPAPKSDAISSWLPGAGEVMLDETPAADGGWRGHVLARCEDGEAPSASARSCLATCYEFYSEGSGSDGMIEMELCLDRGIDHPLVRLTLAQLYLMAGQGEPKLLPVEGPAADTGDWHRNRRRLLQRARSLLESVGDDRPDDAAVDYLLADVARAEGEVVQAAELEARGYGKCTGGASFDLLRQYQDLNRYPARLLALPTPEYPQAAVQANLSGPVVLDLLLDPAGQVRQTVTVRSPGQALTDAAVAAFRDGGYEPARIGKYPVWAWLRVTTSFNLSK